MSEVIVAYQPRNSCHLYDQLLSDKAYFLSRNTFKLGKALCVDRQIIAKWTIKPKGGIPKLDTPILSEEDVKDLND